MNAARRESQAAHEQARMDPWTLVYEGFVPEQQKLRETLCALGNGYFVTRAAAAEALAEADIHYPGTYLAGGYNRLVTEIAGREIENEDLVNIPNWLPLVLRIGSGPWLRPAEIAYEDYRQELRLREGVLIREFRLRDALGQLTRWREERLVSMAHPHLAGLMVEVTPENWSGELTIRSGLDGSVVNDGVPRYRALKKRHLETLAAEPVDPDLVFLRSRMVQSRREIALVARTRLFHEGAPLTAACETVRPQNEIAQQFGLAAEQGRTVRIEKTVAIVTSKDDAISEPGLEALKLIRRAGPFAELMAEHKASWHHLWEQVDIRIDAGDPAAQLKLRLHIFHLLQTVSFHSIEHDVGVPPRGWHGEAYRGHIMWDELFIFPFLNHRVPVITRSLLRYRYRRLDEARCLAREEGYRGAMFPWMSGSDGREETQQLHLNPMSGRWIADISHRQRHVNAAIAYNVWQYYQVTDDRYFMFHYGAELMFEIARLWASMAIYNKKTDRFDILGVMGPDEYQTADPGANGLAQGGLRNNAYTNVMAAWCLLRALDVVDLLPTDRRLELAAKLHLSAGEIERWDEVSRRLTVPFLANGIIAQFEGYEDLLELDWAGYREKYGDIHRLDRILEAEGDDPNRYKASKQADPLMLFYLFSVEELTMVLERLGYRFPPEMIQQTIDYYMQRTSHGSTLSWIAHAWVLARSDRAHSWELALQALDADFRDVQGGTTPEGIHLGAMAGSVDLLQRCYTGLELQADLLRFNPVLPEGLACLETTIRYRTHTLDLKVTHEELTVSSRPVTASPIMIAYRGQTRRISPGQTFTFRLVPPPDERRGPDQERRRQLREDCIDRRQPRPGPATIQKVAAAGSAATE